MIQSNNAVYIKKGTSENIAIFNADGAIELFHDNVKKFETVSDGAHMTRELRVTGTSVNDFESGRVRLTEGGEAMLGGYVHYDGAANLLHLGTHPQSDSTVGNDVDAITMNRTSGSNDVKLLYNGSLRFQTDVNGCTVHSTRMQHMDNTKAQFGTGGDLQIYHDGTDDVIHSTGTSLRTRSNIFRANNAANTQVMFRATAGGNFEAYHNGSIKFETTSSGVNISGQAQIDGHCFPYSNNAYDLGLSGNRWRNIYTNDLNLSNKGSTNSVDNTWGDYTIQEGESDLFLINNRIGKKFKFMLQEVS